MIKTEKLKVVVFSGGTGAASLLKGLKYFDKTGQAMQVTSIVNAYDDGKSTGDVRRICNVLGPSDIRKNQWHQYVNSHNIIDKSLEEFFTKRFNITRGEEKQFIQHLLDMWDFEKSYKDLFNETLTEYFLLPDAYNISYTDFNISNLFYAMLFRTIGYEKTIQLFKSFLGIEDDVILISEDNLQLKAISQNGVHIHTEAQIVSWENPSDPITKIYFTPYNKHNLNSTDNISLKVNSKEWKNLLKPTLNPRAIESIISADLIIFAPGTQWSSLIPTYATKDFNNILKQSKAKKILLMNNSTDGDTRGINSNDLIKYINKYLNLDNIDIFINKDADTDFCDSISNLEKTGRFFIKSLGCNSEHLHDFQKTAKEILTHYYNLYFTNIKFFDFDDTIYSRDPKHKKISEDNLDLLNKIGFKKDQTCIVITGNDYDTIHKKLVKKFGSDLGSNNISFHIWADGGVVNYFNGKVKNRENKFLLEDVPKILDILALDLDISKEKIFLRGDWPNQKLDCLTCIGIKPLTELEKTLLIKYLNFKFEELGLNNVAKKIGLTGIDILNKETNKVKVMDYYADILNNDTMYIGDELEDGNDKEISDRCKYKYNVKSPYDTNILLTLILNNLEEVN